MWFISSSQILLQAFIYNKENLIVKIPEVTNSNVVIHPSNPHTRSSYTIKLMGRGSIAFLDPRDGVQEDTKPERE